jgi:hypothetical protein
MEYPILETADIHCKSTIIKKFERIMMSLKDKIRCQKLSNGYIGTLKHLHKRTIFGNSREHREKI